MAVGVRDVCFGVVLSEITPPSCRTSKPQSVCWAWLSGADHIIALSSAKCQISPLSTSLSMQQPLFMKKDRGRYTEIFVVFKDTSNSGSRASLSLSCDRHSIAGKSDSTKLNTGHSLRRSCQYGQLFMQSITVSVFERGEKRRRRDRMNIEG